MPFTIGTVWLWIRVEGTYFLTVSEHIQIVPITILGTALIVGSHLTPVDENQDRYVD